MCSYLRLIRFHYHVTFLIVVFGAVSFRKGSSLALAGSLIVLYLAFNVLLYGGLYALNDVADIKSDLRHPLKKNRPLPSGAICARKAVVFAAASIALGILGALVCFGIDFLVFFLAFSAINAVYSLQARQLPYLDLVVNSATYPLRYMMGVVLAGGSPPTHHLLAVFAVAFGIVCLRRMVELETWAPEARRALRHYSQTRLLAFQLAALAALLVLFSSKAELTTPFFVTAIVVYLLLVFGSRLSGNARGMLRALWTK